MPNELKLKLSTSTTFCLFMWGMWPGGGGGLNVREPQTYDTSISNIYMYIILQCTVHHTCIYVGPGGLGL